MDLHGRSLLKDVDFTKEEFLFIIDLAEELRRDKHAGAERQRWWVATSPSSSRSPRPARARRSRSAPTTRAPTSPTSDPDESHLGHKESTKDTARVLGRMFDGIEYRGFAQDTVETLGQYAGVPVWNGLTDQWHPTQMLADVLTMRDHADKPLEQLTPAATWATGATTRRTRCWSPGRCSASTCASPPPAPCCPPRLSRRPPRASAGRRAPGSGSGDEIAALVEGADFLYTDVWVSMGEPDSAWDERIDQLLPYQVNAELIEATGNPDVKFMHCLPALHNRETEVGGQTLRQVGSRRARGHRRGLRVAASIVFDQAENRLHTIKAVMVATARSTEMRIVVALGGNALLRAGRDRPTPRSRRHTWWPPSRPLAPLARDHELVITHGNGPQVGLLALESARDPSLSHPYPLDVLGAQTQGMIGYWLLQALQNAVPGRQVACLVTQTLVAADDPAFGTRRPSSSARSTTRRRRSAWPPYGGGRCAPTVTPGAGWWRLPTPWPWSRSRWSSCSCPAR